ncbi:diaminopimelate epimerase [Bifidobacterium sp. SMB2]|uniref:Diaminopimelate epimerase n=1 Tax=Bifidobacterium saimiriisciurei TaxID=2661627 RepID=A0ABX0CAM2_9BIFI|nr:MULTISPECIES: diaminopimelate epimerase [Bifidobacterium]NEG95899.1 diaminopimelate epimerase [Bifidobacterium sp. SMB2]NEH11746.1 diaminopimelate epimerase [Bifidobacterium saimiriisciurei]
MSIPQTVYKGHGTGNDFVVYADPNGEYEPTGDEIRFLDDRHFGIGGDGLLRLTHPRHVSDLDADQVAAFEQADVEWFMDYRNADGSLAEMCGNGTRVTALFAQMMGYAAGPGGEPFRLGTRAGVKTLTSLGEVEGLGRNVFRIDMGAWKSDEAKTFEVTIPGTDGSARGTFVDMGNPHVVAVVEDRSGNGLADDAALPAVADLDLVTKPVVAPVLESDQNAEFVRVDAIDRETNHGVAFMRVNERGCGETFSCGTGLCATAVTLRKLTGVDDWAITVRGGTLMVHVDDVHVELTGDAAIVGRVELL